MQSFEQIRSHVGSRHTLRTNDPYLISFDFDVAEERHQGVYLTEVEGEDGDKYLRISTPVGPFTGMDPARCLRFNWEQRVGFLALSNLDGSPYLHLCENRPYAILDGAELDRVVTEIATLGDHLERTIYAEGEDVL